MRRSTLARRSRVFIEQLENRLLLSTGLVVTYNNTGISTLSYNGQTLINVPQYGSSNAYQVNRYYTLNSDGTYNAIYGGTGYSSNWNAATLTLTYTYSFGSIAVQFVQPTDSRLNMIFTVTNNANSGVTLGGVDIYPASIHFPNPIPVSYYVGSTAMWSPMVDTTLDGPSIIPANYQSGTMAFVNDSDPTKPIYTSLFTLDNTTGENYYMFVGTGPKDNLSSSLPFFYRDTAPGQTDSFEDSMRFGPAGTDPYSLAPDVEQAYSAAYPDLVNWPDRRAIASLHLTSPPTTSQNPEGWFGSTSLDVTTQSGLNNFGAQLLQFAQNSVTQMKADNAQGMIVWDVEGQEWPQATTYIGDPALAFDTRIEQGVTLSNGTVTTPMGYNYLGGGALIDQFFAIFRNAGFRTGLTIRPTEVEFDANGTPSQVTANEASELEAKITYAYNRWGCTIFYVDSNSGYDRDALRAVQKMFPYVLLIPEHSTTATYGESAPYGQLLTYNFTGTPSYVYDTYPNAFSVIYPADGDNGNSGFPDYYNAIEQSVANGDIILFRGWFNDPYNTTMNQIYAQAAAVPPTPTGLTATPGISAVQLNWNAVTGKGVFGTGVYNVKRSTSATGTYTTIASGVFGPSFTDTTAKGNTKYYYEVSAVDGAGESPNSTSMNATVTVTAIAGDQDYSNEADTIRIVRSGSYVNVYRNNATTPAYQLAYATTPEVSITAGGGSDTIIVDYSGGDPVPPTGLSIDGGTGTDLISVIGTGGNDSIAIAAGTIAVNGGAFTYSNAETLALSLSSGNSTLTDTGTAPVTGAFDLSLAGSAALTVANPTYLDVASLNLANNSSLILAPGGNTTLETPSLSIASTATLQLNDNAVILDYTTTAPTSVAAALAIGLSSGTGTGPGITSSLMSGNSGIDIGTMDNATSGLTTFNSTCVITTSLSLRATWTGDVNMDGYLNSDDLSLLLLNQQKGRTGWSAGDFNYDTKINADDTALLMYAIAVSKNQPVPSVTQSSVVVDADLQSLLTDDGSVL